MFDSPAVAFVLGAVIGAGACFALLAKPGPKGGKGNGDCKRKVEELRDAGNYEFMRAEAYADRADSKTQNEVEQLMEEGFGDYTPYKGGKLPW
jgi:hypothetical protein